MATVVGPKEGFLEISSISDDVDFNSLWPDHLGFGFSVRRIEFVSSAASDKLVVKESSDSGPTIAELGPGGGKLWESPKRMNPYIDVSECTLEGTYKVLFELAD